MARKTDKYAGWRPRYKTRMDPHGYSLEYVASDDPDFPLSATRLLGKKDGLTFIVQNSMDYKKVLIDGTNALYLDFLNLECGLDVEQNIKRFLNDWGPPNFSSAKKPSRNAVIFATIDPLLERARSYRSLVGKLIDNGRKEILGFPEYYGYGGQLDLATGELVVEARTLYSFIFLQIADVFSSGQRIANCEVCSAFMTPSRSTRKHCSDACRQMAHRSKAS